jgi:hypothetical protein
MSTLSQFPVELDGSLPFLSATNDNDADLSEKNREKS